MVHTHTHITQGEERKKGGGGEIKGRGRIKSTGGVNHDKIVTGYCAGTNLLDHTLTLLEAIILPLVVRQTFVACFKFSDLKKFFPTRVSPVNFPPLHTSFQGLHLLQRLPWLFLAVTNNRTAVRRVPFRITLKTAFSPASVYGGTIGCSFPACGTG